MSTRSVIAEPLDGGWRGRYCHWGGSPAGLGRVLFHAVRDHFRGDVRAARAYLLYQHTGWSTISLQGFVSGRPPGYIGPTTMLVNQCYCHGERDEQGGWITSANPNTAWTEWAYVLGTRGLLVLRRDGDGNVEWWTPVARIPWMAPEPNWEAMETAASLEVNA